MRFGPSQLGRLLQIFDLPFFMLLAHPLKQFLAISRRFFTAKEHSLARKKRNRRSLLHLSLSAKTALICDAVGSGGHSSSKTIEGFGRGGAFDANNLGLDCRRSLYRVLGALKGLLIDGTGFITGGGDDILSVGIGKSTFSDGAGLASPLDSSSIFSDGTGLATLLGISG